MYVDVTYYYQVSTGSFLKKIDDFSLWTDLRGHVTDAKTLFVQLVSSCWFVVFSKI